jgi:hypothetical protein
VGAVVLADFGQVAFRIRSVVAVALEEQVALGEEDHTCLAVEALVEHHILVLVVEEVGVQAVDLEAWHILDLEVEEQVVLEACHNLELVAEALHRHQAFPGSVVEEAFL